MFLNVTTFYPTRIMLVWSWGWIGVRVHPVTFITARTGVKRSIYLFLFPNHMQLKYTFRGQARLVPVWLNTSSALCGVCKKRLWVKILETYYFKYSQSFCKISFVGYPWQAPLPNTVYLNTNFPGHVLASKIQTIFFSPYTGCRCVAASLYQLERTRRTRARVVWKDKRW